MEIGKEQFRRKLFFFVLFVSLIIAFVSAGIDVLWIKKSIWILLVLTVFSFSETAHQIYDQVRDEFRE